MPLEVNKSSEGFSGFPKLDLLLKSGYASKEQITLAWRKAISSKEPFLSILQSLVGSPLSDELKRQWKKYQLFEAKIVYGVETLEPEIDSVNIQEIENLINSLIPIELCTKYQLFPLKQEPLPFDKMGRTIDVVMVDPSDFVSLEQLEKKLKKYNISQIDWHQKVILEEDFNLLKNKLIDHIKHTKIQEKFRRSVAEELEKFGIVAEELGKMETKEMNIYNPQEDLLEDSPVIKLVNLILRKSCAEGISEVYLEPAEYYLNIRARKEGEIVQLFDPLPRKIISSVVNRLKIMSGLDITVKNKIQEGKLKIVSEGKKREFYIKTVPAKYGEKVTLSILNILINQLKIADLIDQKNTLDKLTELFNSPAGLLLVSGPRNSGKTLTSYTILAEKIQQGMTVGTVEEQVKYSLPNINQVELNPKSGIDYETGIQSFLMEDVNVIFVDHIPDIKTAKTLVEASITGHLVLTNVLAHDTVSAIAYLNEIGLSLSTLGDTLIGVMNQRLIRRLCSECRVSYHPKPTELATFFPLETRDNLNLYRAKIDSKSDHICPKCKGTGYHGLIGVYEILPVTKQIRTLMANKADYLTIKNAALQEGMTPLFSYGLDLVLQGKTTLEEIEQIFPQEVASLKQEAKKQEAKVEIQQDLATVYQAVDNETILHSLTRLENQVQTLTLEIKKISKILQENQNKPQEQEPISPKEIKSKENPKNYDIISDPW